MTPLLSTSMFDKIDSKSSLFLPHYSESPHFILKHLVPYFISSTVRTPSPFLSVYLNKSPILSISSSENVLAIKFKVTFS